MKRIHVIGRKNSGKTTLICELVKHLFARGVRVGTIKHTHHHHELDTPGKDSYRHSQAGAAAVGILSPGMNAVFWPAVMNDDISGRYDRLLEAFHGCDVVLVEGDSRTEALKIEVWRAEVSDGPLAIEDKSIHAVVTDDPIRVSMSVWSRSDVAAIATRLVELSQEGPRYLTRYFELRSICDGCRARAYFATGNPFAQDPDCCYVPADRCVKMMGARRAAIFDGHRYNHWAGNDPHGRSYYADDILDVKVHIGGGRPDSRLASTESRNARFPLPLGVESKNRQVSEDESIIPT